MIVALIDSGLGLLPTGAWLRKLRPELDLLLQTDPDGTVWLECSCGTVLRNGPTWTLDEHVRLHRAEAKYLELSAGAPAGIPRLIDLR